MKRAFFSVATIGSAVLLAALAGGSAAGISAAPTTVVCGQTLTTSTTLANDLVDCPGTALVVGADGITIDLNGHTLDGTGAAGSEGIADDGHQNLRVANGAIQQFRVDGVGLRGAPGSVVANMTVREIGVGREGQEETAGVVVLGSAETLLAHNRLDDNCLDGVLVSGSPSSRIIGNELNDNCNVGVQVDDSDSTSLFANHASRNRGAGIGIGNVRGASIVGNHVDGSFFGFIYGDLRDSLISLNRVTGNFLGIDLFPESTGNRFVRNSFSWNGVGIVIESDDNLIAGNVVSHNQNPDDPGDPGGGIAVFGTGNTIRSNVADANGNANGGDGILVGVPGNTLTANGANRNGGHGIEAEPGTIDGGGNHAHANSLKPDCIGVVCS
jgi:parallel beta-helix repeat protein